MNVPIKIGTRNSALALWQAREVASQLEMQGLQTLLVPMETKGDKKLEVTIAKIGSKGVFTEELEAALLSGEIHIAVHSAKDMQSSLDPGLELLAFGKREAVNDVVVSHNPNFRLGANVPCLIGTSSTRRRAQLARHFPLAETVETRGNLQTRIRKMEEGLCEAIILAKAGVDRMGYSDKIVQVLPVNQFVPAVGQGSIAIECVSNLPEDLKLSIRKACNNLEAETAVLAERAFLNYFNGGCSIPIYCFAEITNNHHNAEDKLVDLSMVLNGGIISLDGRQWAEIQHFEVNLSGIGSPEANLSAASAGQELAKQIALKGGMEILSEIKRQLGRV